MLAGVAASPRRERSGRSANRRTSPCSVCRHVGRILHSPRLIVRWQSGIRQP
jgi:hypothetical protein